MLQPVRPHDNGEAERSDIAQSHSQSRIVDNCSLRSNTIHKEVNMSNLKIEYVSKDQLKPYAKNAKMHTNEQVEQIKRSIEEFAEWGLI